MKSGEDDAAYHARLGRIFKEKYGEDFRFLPCYFFLRDKLKFHTLVAANDEKKNTENEDMSTTKRSIGGKEERPLGNKRAKQLKKIEDMAEHLGTKFGIVKKEKVADDTVAPRENDTAEARSLLGKALNDFTSMARSGFQSWHQSMMLQHASENVRRELADAALRQEIRRMEKESMEQDATDVLMQLPNKVAGASSTSSLSSPEVD